MKIAHLVSTFPPYFGGMGNAVYGMAEELARRGHEVTVLTSKQKKFPPPTDGSSFSIKYLQPFGRYGNAAFLPQLFWILDDYDIVHLHYPFFGGAEIAALWRFSRPFNGKKKKLIITYHMDALTGGMLGRFFAWHNRHLLPFILSAADRVIVTSTDYAEHSLIKTNEQWMKEKFFEIPIAVDANRFTPREKDTELLRQQKIDPGSFVFLFVGALDRAHAFKGVDVLLRAFKLFCEFQKQNASAYTLVIIGDGALRPGYAALVHELEMQPSVRFAGRVNAEDLPKYYTIADVVVLPSTSQSEAFGTVLLEAMASGKPVIASNLPGVRKVVLERRTGVLTKPGDVVGLAKIFEVFVHDVELRLRYGTAGRERVLNRYTWEVVGEGLERIYR